MDIKILSKNYFCTQLDNRVQVYTLDSRCVPKKVVTCRDIETAIRWIYQYGEN